MIFARTKTRRLPQNKYLQGRCWAGFWAGLNAKWVMGKVGQHIVREFVYGLAAVSPLDGQRCSLIVPWVDTETMSVFLAHTAALPPRKLPDVLGWSRMAPRTLLACPTLHPLTTFATLQPGIESCGTRLGIPA